jgi:hypothetical protein
LIFPLVALDDQTPDELWRFNVAVANAAHDPRGECANTSPFRRGCWWTVGQITTRPKGRNPELRDQWNATVLYVFGL